MFAVWIDGLDQEIATLHVPDASARDLRAQAEIMAEGSPVLVVDKLPDEWSRTDPARWIVDEAAGELRTAPQPVPVSVERWALRAVFRGMPAREGTYLDAVDAFIAASNDPVIQAAWSDKPRIERHGRFVARVAETFQLPDAQVDEVFRQAAELEAIA